MCKPNAFQNISQDEIAHNRQHHVGRLFHQMARDYSQRALELLHASGHSQIKPFQAELISQLDIEGTRITELARRLGTTKQSAGEAVKALESLGYLARQKDPLDARATVICFTAQGQQLLSDAYQLKKDLEAEYAEILGQTAFEQLKKMLQVLVQAH